MIKIRLGSKEITGYSAPYLIAEIGVNHEGSMEKATEMIQLAKEGGADAVKFQTYKAVMLAVENSPSYWDLSKEPTNSQRKLFSKYDRFEEREYGYLAHHCEKVGIDFVSTPFDDAAVDFLDPMLSFFKVASADLNSLPFLRKIGRKGKPIVLSTGAATTEEIRAAVSTLEDAGSHDIVLLHCILSYPTAYEDANLNMIEDLHRNFPRCLVGYSDHTLPDSMMTVLTTAYLKGARVLEKHFTYDKNLPGNDHYHAMDVHDLKRFKEQLNWIRSLEGQCSKSLLPCEEVSRTHARRSLVLKKDVKKGGVLTEEVLTYKRPGTGISPESWDRVIGMRAVRDLQEDTVLTWEDVTREA